ncbi:hypothetical protein PRIPAC_76436 [Pristionchus pacificus]|uniref:Uncharacterized protein n=1 Tax=Pristionchus pacificus TaxID=54126 RepID=A0A2A6BRV8_PRIPA|nr:hypothetical protein PRIPAC_76436 [Pristionchus pacificus]|eukprot:PDM68491.1 hypothetical protein PRIPAC_43993 [Pristionchus pacificus]
MLDVLPPELLTSIVDHTATNDQLNTSLIRFDHSEQRAQKVKRRLLVTLSRRKDAKGNETVMDTMTGDDVDDDSLPSTSSDGLPKLKEIMTTCIHGSSLILHSLPITSALLSALSSSSTEIRKVTTVTFDLCVFADQEGIVENIRAFLFKTSVQSLTFEFCREEGERRIICDELFADLPHLQRLYIQERMPGKNGITKQTVDRWIATTVPYMVDFRNMESNIDAESVRKIIEFTLGTPRRYKTVWNLGTIRPASNRELTPLMLSSHRELIAQTHIDTVGQRHFKISHPTLEMVFAMKAC